MNYVNVSVTKGDTASLDASARSTGKERTRSLLRRFFRWILRQRSSPLVFDPGAVTLVLAPHPDDEVFGCGGLIRRQRLAGQSVHVVYLTDGSASHPNHPTLSSERLKMLRAEEARRALEILGVDPATVHFLEAQDGVLDTLNAEARKVLLKKIEDVLFAAKPNAVFLPYRRDGSSEHEGAFRLFEAALSTFSPRPRVYEFPVWSWWSPRLLFRLVWVRARVLRCDLLGYEAIKRRAIASYRSQTDPVPPWLHAVLPKGFVQAFDSSEEFFLEIAPPPAENQERTTHE